MANDQYKFSEVLSFAGGLGVVVGLLIGGSQVWVWLKDGDWHPLSVATVLYGFGSPEIRIVQPLVGLQKLLDWTISFILGLPASVAVAFIGFMLLGIGEKVEAREAERERLNKRTPDQVLGLATVYPMRDYQAERYGLENPCGLVVVHVWPDSVAACAGVESGDVILTFGDKPVATIDDLQNVLLSARNRAISLTVWRDNAEIPLSLKLYGPAKITGVRDGELQCRSS
jgi:membrane-associated protease RseP (regulator of RpoE activity)